ncbi:MAG TPA: choice-of-anchor tandem repeat GloVer-containing protein, partial [Terriglobales bacterium]|nr:choice-of-anchor tandem repeat GloVer-containing protein [Terriglobales bacterium]
MTPGGTYKVLHTFDSKTQPDGTGIYGMVQAPDGNLYGTTVAGAQFKPFNSVFRFDLSTGQYTILHGFNTPNINLPGVATSAPTLASTGELFGLQAFGQLYEISLAGKYQKIGNLSPSGFFDGHILQASDGNLWGDFLGGDCSGEGIAFSASTTGSLLQNLTFDCTTIGEQPAAMIQAADGKFYGVTLGDGGVNTNSVLNGTIWSLDAGLAPAAVGITAFRPASGNVGSSVIVEGNHFVGTTAVSVNGTNVAFQVLSVNYLKLTVPSGATTGPIMVTNAGGTTTSAKSFTVP